MASGSTAVQIVRRKNRRDVVIEHLGSAHSEAELASLMKIGRRKIEEDQGMFHLGLEPDQDPVAAVVQTQTPVCSSTRPAPRGERWGSSDRRRGVLPPRPGPGSRADIDERMCARAAELRVAPAHRNTSAPPCNAGACQLRCVNSQVKVSGSRGQSSGEGSSNWLSRRSSVGWPRRAVSSFFSLPPPRERGPGFGVADRQVWEQRQRLVVPHRCR